GFLKPGSEGGQKTDPSCVESCIMVQPESVTGAIAAVTVLLPLALIIVALIMSRFFHLDRSIHQVLLQETARLENGGAKADVEPEVRVVLEKLTGRKYHRLWPA